MSTRQTNKTDYITSEFNGKYRLDNVSKYFGNKPGLVDVSLASSKGKIHCVCGANAAGKSTLVKVFAGLLVPDKGEINSPGKEKTGVMLHQSMLYPKLSITENLQFYARLYGIKKNKRYIDELLDSSGLKDLKFEKIEVLSAGMQKRVSFARAIVNRPELVLLDEPFSGLDEEGTEKIKKSIKKLTGNNSAVLITTHQVSRVIEFCDELSVLDKGKLVMNEKAEYINKQNLCRDYPSPAGRSQ